MACKKTEKRSFNKVVEVVWGVFFWLSDRLISLDPLRLVIPRSGYLIGHNSSCARYTKGFSLSMFLSFPGRIAAVGNLFAL